MAEAGSSGDEREDTAVVSWFELFYDLVVVAAVSLCNDAYLARPSLNTGLGALLSIAALSWVWFMTTVFNNVFPGDDLIRRLLLLAQMGCIVVAALAVDQVEGLSDGTGLFAYGLSIAIIAVLVLRERGGAERARVAKGGVVPVVVAAVICIGGAFLPERYSGGIVLLALLVSVGSALSANLNDPDAASLVRFDHIRERRGLFILIILGEGFASLVAALHDLGSIPRSGVFALTFLLSFALWWIYFDGTFAEGRSSVIAHWRLSLLAHLTLIYGMAGTLDILVLVTVQEEHTLGDSTLTYFASCLALVFFSFAVLGFTARNRLGRPGWVQIVSGLLVLVVGVIGTLADQDQTISAVMTVAAALVVANALFAVWTERSTLGVGWRANLRAVIGKPGTRDDLLG